MNTIIHISNEAGLTTIVATNEESDYCLWKLDSNDKNGIYFEYEDQINGSYNNVIECLVTHDGIHIVLADSQLYHFYFNNVSSEQFNSLVYALKNVYPDSILEIVN